MSRAVTMTMLKLVQCFRGVPFLGSFITNYTNQYQQISDQSLGEEDENNSTTPIAAAETWNDAQRFLKAFNTKFGNNHPEFFVGDSTRRNDSLFRQIREKAKREYRPVLIYLHSHYHQNTSSFYVICTDAFKDYVNENFIFFAIDTSSAEGYELGNHLGATTYPFLAVVIVLNSKAELMAKIEGVIGVDPLIAKLIDIHDRVSPTLAVQRADDDNRNMERVMREEQDRAYEEAVERDRQAMEARQKKEEEEKRQKELAEQRKLEKEQRIVNIQKEREELRKLFSQEPEKSSETCLIRFKFPNGAQSQRRFLKTDSVKVLYQYVHSMENEWKPRFDSSLENYELTTSFPKAKLDINKNLSESNCYPQAAVFVHESVNEEEAE